MTSLVFNGSTPPFLAMACSGLENGPSFTSQISSMAAVCMICFTLAGSSTPGNWTRISNSASARPYCWMTGSVRPRPLMRCSMVRMERSTVSLFSVNRSEGRMLSR